MRGERLDAGHVEHGDLAFALDAPFGDDAAEIAARDDVESSLELDPRDVEEPTRSGLGHHGGRSNACAARDRAAPIVTCHGAPRGASLA